MEKGNGLARPLRPGGRSPSNHGSLRGQLSRHWADPPDPLFPAVSVPTLGSGWLPKQCSASPRGGSSCSSSATFCVARSSAPADSASLLELRVRLYLTRDRLHGPHRRSLAVARDDTELDDLPHRIWRSPRRHSIISAEHRAFDAERWSPGRIRAERSFTRTAMRAPLGVIAPCTGA